MEKTTIGNFSSFSNCIEKQLIYIKLHSHNWMNFDLWTHHETTITVKMLTMLPQKSLPQQFRRRARKHPGGPRGQNAPRLRSLPDPRKSDRSEGGGCAEVAGGSSGGLPSPGSGMERGWGVVEGEGQRMAPQKLPEPGSLSDGLRAVKSGRCPTLVSSGGGKIPAPSRHVLLPADPGRGAGTS